MFDNYPLEVQPNEKEQWEERVDLGLRTKIGHQAGWLLFFGSILGAWGALFAMQPGLELSGTIWQETPMQTFVELCRTTANNAGYTVAFAMWALMSLAMMAPTSLPTFKTYSDLPSSQELGNLGFFALFAGYLSIWLGFSALAAFLQITFAKINLLDGTGKSLLPVFNATLLALAGAYQFSKLKDACVSSCRSPLMFFMANWRDGRRGAYYMGLKLGVICLGCCWALMLLAFVAGTMNLLFMGLATIMMILEKLPEVGARISTPLGLALFVGAALTLSIEYWPLT